MAKVIKNPSTGTVSNPELLTKQQAADYIQVTPRYINRMVAQGKLKALKPSGKLFRVRLSDLDSFLESGATIAA